MKKMSSAIFLLLVVFTLAISVSAGEKYKSLRGDADIKAGSTPPAKMDWKQEDSSMPRTFVHQPPLIPHAVEEYHISTSDNDCLYCHGVPNSGAPKPDESHYFDRDGRATEGVSSRWHFCTQCHVGQVDAKPLIENTFQAK